MKKIAYLGITGSYSYEACKNVYPNCETIECHSFEDIIKKVQCGDVDLGMLPVANSSAYRVANVHNLLPKMDLHIVKEYVHNVNHCLLGIPNSKLSDLKEVYSHPQALMQCSDNCIELGIKQNSYANTASASKYVAELGDKTKAAISSKLSAEIYGLKILKENLQDKNNNRTTFWVVQKELDIPMVSEKNVTTLLLTTKNIVASLYKVLGGFATHGVNLLSIESYANVNDADFLITIEGNIEEENVKLALEEVEFFTKNIKILGVYNKG
ncbi:MAG: prephenate dehydratase [Alphaproteobacteria bacterium]|nr:prephenate dehydratase [Alphaproteobacteria bacterium]